MICWHVTLILSHPLQNLYLVLIIGEIPHTLCSCQWYYTCCCQKHNRYNSSFYSPFCVPSEEWGSRCGRGNILRGCCQKNPSSWDNSSVSILPLVTSVQWQRNTSNFFLWLLSRMIIPLDIYFQCQGSRNLGCNVSIFYAKISLFSFL